MKTLVILGSSGSIGENVLRVVAGLPGALRVAGLAVGRDYRRALAQAREYGVRHVAVADVASARACRREAPDEIRVYEGPEGLIDLAALEEADTVVCAVVGTAGLRPVMAAIDAGKDVALATKEVLVAAGHLVTEAAARSGSRLLPIDSEHSAIAQCLAGGAANGRDDRARVRRLLLTASGGPFANRPDVDFDRVSVEEALNHPRWDMGRKISIDSATLMNKGLEVIEGHWLFGVPLERIDVVIHPESIVHSMVEFVDGAVLAQMSVPDMRFAIQYALLGPERFDVGLPAMDLTEVGALHFRHPHKDRFPCLALARRAGAAGGSLPAVMNAANEVAVEKFLEKRLPFSGIWDVVSQTMDRHEVIDRPDLPEVLNTDAWARQTALSLCADVRKS